ncbi:CG14005 [Drosophila busckii]|uniref:CG14005 n=1 Tax=Drosophila busckii TaxID=30019 RepID=A0A0M4E2C5_DROBS|nr:uncharacterized protein LOC108608115 [Drosophila busckii]ALC39728.1 CG14005 [Drosophila busckii]
MSDPENYDNRALKRAPNPKQRLRYYTSYEEITLVKLWREHLPNITSYIENLMVYRDISYAMQQQRIKLNKQEVRRRINSYHNKYILERGRIEADPQYKSTWRLFNLVDSMFQPQSTAALSENKTMEAVETKVRKELPSLTPFSRHDCKSYSLDQDPDDCAFLDSQRLPNEIKSETVWVKAEFKSEMEIDAHIRAPLAPANRTLTSASPTLFLEFPSMRRHRRQQRSIMPRTGQITMAQIERLREENEVLAKRVEAEKAMLEIKERESLHYEQLFDCWLHQQEQWSMFLDKRGIVSNPSLSARQSF